LPGPWTVELWRLAGFVLAGVIAGLILGAMSWTLPLALLAYIAWQLNQLRRFVNWIRSGRRDEPPRASGVWGDLINEHYRLYLRNRRRKKKIAKLLTRFHETSAAMPDATVILGPRFEIEWFNDAAVRLLELKSPDDVGRCITNLVRHPGFVAYLHGQDYSEPVEFTAGPDTDRHLSARLVPFGNRQFLLSVRDVTRIHRLEQMRRDFVANVSHELRTPLTVITGYLESLVDDARDDPDLVRTYRTLEAQATRMRRIIEDLLTLSRLEAGDGRDAEARPVSVPALAAGLAEDARMLAAEGGLTVEVQADPDLWLNGAESELQSAFSNLVSNAVRYTPAGGRVTLRWYGDEAGAHFEVEDTGIGIASQHIPRLTERFYRVESDRSRASGGTGLGLAIVKHVLQRHDARLRVESRPGEGSRFICDFPPERVLRRPAGPHAASA
jgi:two-component system, OmpR family, phosphate regulon sensor histidine kinase PhoR